MKNDSSNSIMVPLKDLRGITRENKIGDIGGEAWQRNMKKEIHVPLNIWHMHEPVWKNHYSCGQGLSMEWGLSVRCLFWSFAVCFVWFGFFLKITEG